MNWKKLIFAKPDEREPSHCTDCKYWRDVYDDRHGLCASPVLMKKHAQATGIVKNRRMYARRLRRAYLPRPFQVKHCEHFEEKP